MARLWFVCMLAICWLMWGEAAAADPVWIVHEGEPRAEIVVAPTQPRKTRLAAQELQRYLQKISGATLPITDTPSADIAVKLYVGRSEHTDRLGLSIEGLRHGAFRMASGENWLAMLGEEFNYVPPQQPWARKNSSAERARLHTEWDAITGDTFSNPHNQLYRMHYASLDVWRYDGAGSLNAVHEFLRSLGVRWYMPGEIGEVVPSTTSIALPSVGRMVEPDFALRSLRYFYDHIGLSDDEVLWHFRMGIDEGHDTVGTLLPGHGSKFVHMRSEMHEKHPEMFAVMKGKQMLDHHRIGAPCLSSEVFFDKHLQYARAVLDHYGEPMISLDMVDGYGGVMCECDRCRPYMSGDRSWNNQLSDYVFGYVDRVARELSKSHPDRKVSGLAYSAYQDPPSDISQMSPNLAMIYCQARSTLDSDEMRDRNHRRRQAWLDKLPSKELYMWEYYLESWPGRRPYEGIPAYYPRLIKEDLQSLKGISRGDMIEVYRHRSPDDYPWNAHTISHLNVYVTSRLWWDADLDIDALLDEYYTLFYGPASEQMKALIEYSEANWRSMRTDVEAVDHVLKLLDQARDAAGDSIYGQRVDLLVEYTRPLHQLKDRLAKGREGNPEVRSLRRRPEDLTLDGKLDDKFWQGTRTMAMRELATGRPPEDATTVWFAWAEGSLYLGVRCNDRDVQSLDLSAMGEDDRSMFRRDRVEVLLETQTHSYYQIAVSPTGAIADLDRSIDSNTGWSSSAEVATHIGDGYWSAEIRLPVAGDLAAELNPLHGIAGRRPTTTYPWYINVCRDAPGKNFSELSAVAPTGKPAFHDVMKFVKLYVN